MSITLESSVFGLILAASMAAGCVGAEEPVGEPDVSWDDAEQQCRLGGVPVVYGASTEQACAALAAAAEDGSLIDESSAPGGSEQGICCDQECSVNSSGGWSCGPMVCGPCKY